MRMDVISQGVSCGLWMVRWPLWYPWLLVKSTEGTCSGLTGRIQKQGSAEAVPVRRKRRGFALVLSIL